jgi:hypothetical protein
MLFGMVLFAGFRCEKLDCCEPYSGDCPPLSAVLTGSWRLKAYQNVSTGKLETDPEPDGRGVVLSFEEENWKGKIAGHTGANSVLGSYSRDRCELHDVEFGGTKVAEPNVFNSKVWSAMATAGQLTFTKEKLSIYFDNYSEVMLFEKAD